MVPRLQRFALVALGCNGLRGMVRLRDERLPGRPLGIGWPWGRRSELVLWGTAVSAPLALDATMFAVALLPAARAHVVRRMAGFLGGCVVAGQLVEPVVYRLGREDRAVRSAVFLNVALGLLLVVTSRRADVATRRVPSTTFPLGSLNERRFVGNVGAGTTRVEVVSPPS